MLTVLVQRLSAAGLSPVKMADRADPASDEGEGLYDLRTQVEQWLCH